LYHLFSSTSFTPRLMYWQGSVNGPPLTDPFFIERQLEDNLKDLPSFTDRQVSIEIRIAKFQERGEQRQPR
jgi:hypothetical protein